jgi:hypothetical protein
MGGTGTNKGNQSIQFKYYDPLDSDHFDKRNQGIIPVGVYQGGGMTKVDDSNVTVHPLVTEISDGTHQARVQTQSDYVVAVTPATPYIVLSWDWQSLSAWYMDIKSVAFGGWGTDDIIVGKAVYAGSTLVGFDFEDKTVPLMLDQFLKVEALTTPSMKVFVNTGYVSYGSSKIPVAGQESATLTAPTTNPRIDLIWIDTAGNVQIEQGAEAASPVAPDHTNKIVLAEITLQPATTAITQDLINDTRPWVNLGGAGGLAGILSSFLTMGA